MSNGDGLPKGWAEATIGDLLEPLENGRILHHGWSPQCEKGPSLSDDDWGVLKTTAVQDGQYLPEHNKRLPSHLRPRPLLEVKDGDILITCAGPRSRCGVPCLVRTTRQRLILSGKMYRFRVPNPEVNPSYIEALLRTHDAQTSIDRMKTGISDSGLNLTHEKFLRLPARVAPTNEQCRIVAKIEELISDLDAGVAALERAKAKLKRYRATVLKAAVEGKLTQEWRKQQVEAASRRFEERTGTQRRKIAAAIKRRDAASTRTRRDVEAGATRRDAASTLETASQLLERILKERRRKWEEAQLAAYAKAGKKPPANWKDKYKQPAALDETDLPALPEGWCWATLSQVAQVERGKFQHRPRNEPRFYDGAYPFVQIGDLPREGGPITTYKQTLNEAGIRISRMFPAGTVLIAIVGATIANTGVLAFDSCAPDSLVAIRGYLPSVTHFLDL